MLAKRQSWVVGLTLAVACGCSQQNTNNDAGLAPDGQDSWSDIRRTPDLRSDWQTDSFSDSRDASRDGSLAEIVDTGLDTEVVLTDVRDASDKDGLTEGITTEELAVLKELFPAATSFEVRKAMSVRYFEAAGPAGKLGTAFTGARYGFNSEVVSITGIDLEGISVALKVLRQFESWWYRVEWDGAFFGQFVGIDTSKVDEELQDFGEYQVDAISGATYSSEAVIGGFWDAVKQYKKLF